MRHQVRGRKLGRTNTHRLATMRSLSTALIKNQRIVTTVAKAKELRKYVEPVITRALADDTPHNRRQIFSFLNDKNAVTLLYDEIVPTIGSRPGGYTRIIKLGTRSGDGAPTALIELVDFNDVKPDGATSKKKRTRRAGRKKSTQPATEESESTSKADDAQEAQTDSDSDADQVKADSADTTADTDTSSESADEKKSGDKA